MKKVFLVLALVAAYGVSMAMSGTEMTSEIYNQVTIVADADDNGESPEKEKATKKEAKATASKSSADGCATAKSSGCSSAKAEASTTAKADGCSTAKAEGCSSKKSASAEKVAENK